MSASLLSIATKFAKGTTGATTADTQLSATEINSLIAAFNANASLLNEALAILPGVAVPFETKNSYFVDDNSRIYKPSTNAPNDWSAQAVSSLSLSAGADGGIWQTLDSTIINRVAGIIGFKTTAGLDSAFNKDASAYIEISTSKIYANGGTGVFDTTISPVGTKYIGTFRENSSTSPVIKIKTSLDQINWQTIYTFSGLSNAILTGRLYVKASLLGPSTEPNCYLISPRGVNLS